MNEGNMAELFHALKTLHKNPYLRLLIEKIVDRKILLWIILGYIIVTIAHFALSWKAFSFSSTVGIFLVADLALQTTYLQQQSLLFIISCVVLPVIATHSIIKEKSEGRLPFARLTPLSKHQIIIGIISRNFVYLLTGIILHLPITFLCVLIKNVTFSYVVIMGFQLLTEMVLFSLTGLLIGLLCNKKLELGVVIALILFSLNFVWNEFILLDKGENSFALKIISDQKPIYIKNNPFRIMSVQGMQLSPMRVQIPYYLAFLYDYGKNYAPAINYRSAFRYNLSELLLNKAVFQKLLANPEIGDSARDVEKSIKDLEKLLVIKVRPYLYNELNNFKLYLKGELSIKQSDNTVVSLSSDVLYKEINKRIDSLRKGIKLLRYRKRILYLGSRKKFDYSKENLLINIINLRKHIPDNQIFHRDNALYTELLKLELEETDLVIEKLTEANSALFRNYYGTLDFDLFKHIRSLLLFIKYSSWWPNEKSTEKISSVEKKFIYFISQITTVKLPISLQNTNCTELSWKTNEILLSLFYSNLLKIIFILTIYFFIYKNIFSADSLYLSPSINVLLSFIIGITFASSVYTDDNVIAYSLYYTVYTLPICLLLLYNSTPLPKIGLLRFWEKTIIIINPLLLISIMSTCILIWYNNQIPTVKLVENFFWGFELTAHMLYRTCILTLISYEFARLWLSFRLSKFASGITALGFAMLFVTITSIIEKPKEFNSIKHLLAIHAILLLIYLLKHIRKSRLRISQ